MAVNRFPGMSDLCDKKTSGYYLNKFREYFPEEFDFFPRTFLLPEELEEFESQSKKTKKVFIAKPDGGAHGGGISLVRCVKDLNLSIYKSNEIVV
jgi:tubulin polyglutamylase TTLL11